MRRLIVAAALLAFIAVCCIAGNILVENSCKQISGLLTSAYKAAESSKLEQAGELAERAEKAYTKGEHRLFMFIDHSLVEDLGEQLALLPKLADSETKAEFLSQIDSVKVTITHIERDNKPSIRSVF